MLLHLRAERQTRHNHLRTAVQSNGNGIGINGHGMTKSASGRHGHILLHHTPTSLNPAP